MKRYYIVIALLFFLNNHQLLFCQVNADSVLLAHSEKWKVKLNKGLFGLSKPDFGNFKTLEVSKANSSVIRKKTRDSTYAGAEISGEGTDADISKFITVKKTKFYQLFLATSSDTGKALFAIASVSHEKKQTLLGKMLSKNDEGKNEELDYKRDIPGIITTGIDSLTWKFFISNFINGGGQSVPGFLSLVSIAGGYLANDHDSLAMQLYSSFSADMVIVNQKGEHLAALTFKQKHPDIWIRNDIQKSYQQAIAALFAVIISIKDFSRL